MNEEILKTIEPKSDQLNADDLLAGPRTIKIRKMVVRDGGKGDQPVAVYFDGDDGKPYKPCKSMRRVLVFVWGLNINEWAGRSMTLYRDEHVMFAGVEIGGIRISHMSGIKGDVTLALTASRSNRRPFTVRPLAKQQRNPAAKPPNGGLPCIEQGHRAAEQGMISLADFWEHLTPDQKRDVGGAPQLESWKRTAADVDHGGEDQPETEEPRSGI